MDNSPHGNPYRHPGQYPRPTTDPYLLQEPPHTHSLPSYAYSYQQYPHRTSPSGGPLNFQHVPPSYSEPLSYRYGHAIPPGPCESPQAPLQQHASFHGTPGYQYQLAAQYPPPGTIPVYPPPADGLFSHSRHQSSPHLGFGSSNNPDSNSATNSDAITYPQLDTLLANTYLSDAHPSASASPPAPSVFQNVSSTSPALCPTFSRHNSFSNNPRAHPSSTTFEASHPVKNLQIVPFDASKGSLRVLILHGNLDIWVKEAKNLPNMDMFHKTLGDMFGKLPGNVTSKIEGHMTHKITSDPYVSISISDAVIGRTYVISNSENPVWMQHFYVPVAHSAAEVHFFVKDSDIVGSQLIGSVGIPVEQIYSGMKYEGTFPILNSTGKPCKSGASLCLSVQYVQMETQSFYHGGVGAGPDYSGVPSTYFPLRRGGEVTLYQDAHLPDGCLPNIKLSHGKYYAHGKCWHDMFDAIRQARKLIYITGWSVWHKVKLVRDGSHAPSHTLGDLLKSKSQEGVRVLLLIWDDPTSRSILGYKTDGVMQTHDEETRRFFKHSSVQVLLCPRIAGKRHSWMKQREVETIYTHHQKTVVVDSDAGNYRRKIIAFVGGLDLCDGRYDTPQHYLFRTQQTVHVDDYHNPTFVGNVSGCPREPWHDLHCRIDGPAAYDVLTNFEQRWRRASKPHGIKKLKMPSEDSLLKLERIPEIIGMQNLQCLREDDPEAWHVQLFRSIDSSSVKGFPKDPKDATHANLVCAKNVLVDMSIHMAYVKAIRAAQHFIYIENQYFIGSSHYWSSHKDLGANNLIPIEIALKICDKIRLNERFAAYVVIPMWPEGVPTGAATQRILFWQHKTMQMMYETIHKTLVEVGLEDVFHPQDFLNFFCLGNREALDSSENNTDSSSAAAGAAANSPQALTQKSRRFMIYVHSKGMIIDDEYLIIGSANINQRSMDGTRDTEIAVGAYQPNYTWARKASNPEGQVHAYRMSLWAEHTGVLEDCFMRPETLECVHRIQLMGETNWKRFVGEEVVEMQGHLLKYPVEVDRRGKVTPSKGYETFPDVGGSVVGSFLAIQENLTI